MRDLASVCTIDKVWALEGKDKVQGASFVENSYEVMVGKDIQPGDLVAFIQEGALLPEVPTWEFLRKLNCYKESEKAFLIKCKKFKEIKSWGLCLGLNKIGLDDCKAESLKAGDDLTDLLKIRKYEPAEDASPQKKKDNKLIDFCFKHVMLKWIGNLYVKLIKTDGSSFPSDIISKSDETTIQNYKGMLEKFADAEVYTSCKMEGQSATFLWKMKNGKPDAFMACSRNNGFTVKNKNWLEKIIDKIFHVSNKTSNDFYATANYFEIPQKILDYYKPTGIMLVIQGEQCGVGIQFNIYNFATPWLFVYTMKDQITGKQLSMKDMQKACYELNLPTVPIIETAKLKDIMPDIDTAVSYAEKRYWIIDNGTLNPYYVPNKNEKLWKNYCQHEGVVVRTTDYDKDNDIDDIGCSFKVKNIDYASKTLQEIANVFKGEKTNG